MGNLENRGQLQNDTVNSAMLKTTNCVIDPAIEYFLTVSLFLQNFKCSKWENHIILEFQPSFSNVTSWLKHKYWWHFLISFFLLSSRNQFLGYRFWWGGGGGHFRKNCRIKGCLPTMGNPGIITHSCCEHITGGVNIYLYGRVILLVPECAVCLCLCLCDIKSETSNHSNYVSDLSKLDNLLHKMHSNVLPVLRYQRLTCVDP